LSDVHPNKFVPAAALVRKNVSPIEHAPGKVAPVLEVFVKDALQKSMFLAW